MHLYQTKHKSQSARLEFQYKSTYQRNFSVWMSASGQSEPYFSRSQFGFSFSPKTCNSVPAFLARRTLLPCAATLRAADPNTFLSICLIVLSRRHPCVTIVPLGSCVATHPSNRARNMSLRLGKNCSLFLKNWHSALSLVTWPSANLYSTLLPIKRSAKLKDGKLNSVSSLKTVCHHRQTDQLFICYHVRGGGYWSDWRVQGMLLTFKNDLLTTLLLLLPSHMIVSGSKLIQNQINGFRINCLRICLVRCRADLREFSGESWQAYPIMLVNVGQFGREMSSDSVLEDNLLWDSI